MAIMSAKLKEVLSEAKRQVADAPTPAMAASAVITAYTEVLKWIAANPRSDDVGYAAHCAQWLGIMAAQRTFPLPATPPENRLYMAGTPDGRLYAFTAASSEKAAGDLIFANMEKERILPGVRDKVVPFSVNSPVVMLTDGVVRNETPFSRLGE